MKFEREQELYLGKLTLRDTFAVAKAATLEVAAQAGLKKGIHSLSVLLS